MHERTHVTQLHQQKNKYLDGGSYLAAFVLDLAKKKEKSTDFTCRNMHFFSDFQPISSCSSFFYCITQYYPFDIEYLVFYFIVLQRERERAQQVVAADVFFVVQHTVDNDFFFLIKNLKNEFFFLKLKIKKREKETRSVGRFTLSSLVA